MNTRAEIRGRPLMALRFGAIVVTIASGSYALAALLVGSPLEFGAGLASCGACWIAADFIQWTDERERGVVRSLSRLRCLTLAPDRRIRRVVLGRASTFRARCARNAAAVD
jgi:hypothetical protein